MIEPTRSRRIHLVMVSGNAPPLLDGVADYTAPLMAELARQRPEWRWTWLARRPGWYRSPVVRRDGYTLVRPSSTWGPRGRRIAAWALRRLKPDLLHVQEQIHSYFETDAAPRLAEAAGCPVITTLHEYHTELASVVHTDELVRRSAAIITNDTRNAVRCVERTGREPDARWASGSTIPPPAAAGTRIADSGLVSTFGFIHGNKGLELPYGGLSMLRDRGRKLRWEVIGPFDPIGNPRHAEVAARVVGDWVTFTGALPKREVGRMLWPSRAMLLPYADGASVRRTTLHTAWAFGIPAITTPPPHDEPAIVDGDNCLLVREPTPEAWAEALGRLLDDPQLEKRLSEGGLRTADAFGWPDLARRHLALYDRLLADHDGAPIGPGPERRGAETSEG